MSAAKAVVAAVGTVVTALTGVLADEVVDVGEVSLLVAVLVEAAATVFAVYRVPNKTDESVVSGESGYGLVEILLAVFLIIVIVFVLMRLL